MKIRIVALCNIVLNLLLLGSVQLAAHEGPFPKSIEALPLEQVSERVHVVHGSQELPDAENRGFMNNPGAILTRNGVIVVDPGSSAAIGTEFLDKLRAVTDKPVIAIFNTHIHGDHWLGNHGVRQRYPDAPIYAHERMIERARGGDGKLWLERMHNMTEGAIEGTEIVIPTQGLKGGEVLELDGVTLRIHHTGPAHTDHDLMIEVDAERVMFGGDILVARQVPNSVVPQDSDFKGTLAAIEFMLGRPVSLFVPGHGRSGGLEVPRAARDYLHKLIEAVTAGYRAGKLDYEMKPAVEQALAEYRDWRNHEELGRVISQVYREVERDEF